VTKLVQENGVPEFKMDMMSGESLRRRVHDYSAEAINVGGENMVEKILDAGQQTK